MKKMDISCLVAKVDSIPRAEWASPEYWEGRADQCLAIAEEFVENGGGAKALDLSRMAAGFARLAAFARAQRERLNDFVWWWIAIFGVCGLAEIYL